MYGYRFCNSFFPYGGSITMGIGLILLIVIVYFLFRNNGPLRSHSGPHGDSPMDILQKRFVNGEISREEYLEKQEILKRGK